MSSENQMPVKEIGEMLDMVTKKMPKMISELTKTLFSKEAGENIGKAVGTMYKELIEAGMDKEEAVELAKEYLKTIKDVSTQNMNN